VKRRAALFFILLFLLLVAIDQYWIKRGDVKVERKQEKKSSRISPKHSASQSSEKVSKKEEQAETHAAKKQAEEEAKVIAPQLSVPERLSELGAQVGDPVFIRIFKYTAELEVWIKAKDHYELLHTYEVCRQSGYLGPKLKEGDGQGPEGFYYVTKGRLNPNSKFHLAFNIGYPNAYDRAHKRTGSALMVHGDCVSVGCFAMTDKKIEEIYELVEKALENGQRIVRVHIFPFRMTKRKMDYYRYSKWYSFWSNLKEGYDYFEEKKIPPNVGVKNLQYSFR